MFDPSLSCIKRIRPNLSRNSRFMVNRRIFVVGFGLYGSIHGPSEYSVNIQVKDYISITLLGHHASDLTILECFKSIARSFCFSLYGTIYFPCLS